MDISRRRQGGAEGRRHTHQYHGKSHVVAECGTTPFSTSSSSASASAPSSLVQQRRRWANMPPELLHDIIQRVEAKQTSWPARSDVVACALVCRSWRKITKEIVKTPEQCGSLTFPISLKQVIFFFFWISLHLVLNIPTHELLFSCIYASRGQETVQSSALLGGKGRPRPITCILVWALVNTPLLSNGCLNLWIFQDFWCVS